MICWCYNDVRLHICRSQRVFDRVALLTVLWLVCLIVASCDRKAEARWVTVPPIRRSSERGLLGEIESRMPANHQYRDASVGTWAHETTHGLNSRIRNRRGGTGRVNAFYVPGGKACILQEPRGVTLGMVASAVSGGERYGIRQTYLVKSRQWWNNEPLYLCDEMTAYCNGAYVRIEHGRVDRSQLTLDLYAARTMLAWSHTVVRLAEQHGNDTRELREFLAWMAQYIAYLERRAGR